MNPMLHRLAIAFALISFLGIGAWSAQTYYVYSGLYSELQREVQGYRGWEKQCYDKSASQPLKQDICEATEKRMKELVSQQVEQFVALENAKNHLWLAVALPFLAFFVLYVGTWIVTGQICNTPAD